MPGVGGVPIEPAFLRAPAFSSSSPEPPPSNGQKSSGQTSSSLITDFGLFMHRMRQSVTCTSFCSIRFLIENFGLFWLRMRQSVACAFYLFCKLIYLKFWSVLPQATKASSATRRRTNASPCPAFTWSVHRPAGSLPVPVEGCNGGIVRNFLLQSMH